MNKIKYPLKKTISFGKNQPYSKNPFEKTLWKKQTLEKKTCGKNFEKGFQKKLYFFLKKRLEQNLMQKNKTPCKKQQHNAKC